MRGLNGITVATGRTIVQARCCFLSVKSKYTTWHLIYHGIKTDLPRFIILNYFLKISIVCHQEFLFSFFFLLVMNEILANILWILLCSNGSVDPPTAASILQQLLCVSLLQLLAVMHYLLLCNILAEQVRNMLKGSCVLLMIAHTVAV